MRSHRSWCVIFSASFSTLVGLAAALAHAQLTLPAPLNDKAADKGADKAVDKADEQLADKVADTSANQQPSIRRAYFQSPGDMQMPGMSSTSMVSPPQLPGTVAPSAVAPAFNPNGSMNASAVNPAAFNQFSNPGGPMQATTVQSQPASRLRDSTSGMNAQQPNMGYGAPGAYRNMAMQQPPMQQQTFPPGYGMPSPYAAQQMQMQGQLPPSQLRNGPNAGAVANQQPGNYQQQPVVAGDPRFVMPPTQGAYPTSPYRPQFRSVAYQLPQQSPAVQPVQPPNPLANQAAVLPNTTNLPQYQPTVGQLANYQALQPGYNCAPTIPSNGVPAFVPGAVAPPTLPPNLMPQMYSPDNSGYRPLFSLGQENYNVQLGRGIIGQPTVYVSGQPIRNFLRYLAP